MAPPTKLNTKQSYVKSTKVHHYKVIQPRRQSAASLQHTNQSLATRAFKLI